MMNKISFLTLYILLIFCGQSISQVGLFEELKGEWVKQDIKLKDGSTLYNSALTEGQFVLHVISKDSFLVTFNGRTAKHNLKLVDSTISYRGTTLKIVRLEKPVLEVEEVEVQDGYKPLRMKFVYKPTFDLGYIPDSYLARNEEEVFLKIPGRLEPKFINGQMSAMDYIYNEFRYPEHRKGGFVVRFVVTKDGKLTGARMVASSNNRYDQKLIDAVMKTKGKWFPAMYNGVKVNCEVEFNFDLGFSNSNESSVADQKAFKAEQNLEYANYYFGIKKYKTAVEYYTIVIENDPYSIDAYYKRAASNVFRNKFPEACKDYKSLSALNQVRATELYEEYCKDE